MEIRCSDDGNCAIPLFFVFDLIYQRRVKWQREVVEFLRVLNLCRKLVVNVSGEMNSPDMDFLLAGCGSARCRRRIAMHESVHLAKSFLEAKGHIAEHGGLSVQHTG